MVKFCVKNYIYVGIMNKIQFNSFSIHNNPSGVLIWKQWPIIWLFSYFLTLYSLPVAYSKVSVYKLKHTFFYFNSTLYPSLFHALRLWEHCWWLMRFNEKNWIAHFSLMLIVKTAAFIINRCPTAEATPSHHISI